MSTTTAGSLDPSPEFSRPTINKYVIPSAADNLCRHVNTLLGAIQTLATLSIDPKESSQGSDGGHLLFQDTTVRAAAAASIVQACARLDMLMCEHENWKVDTSEQLFGAEIRKINEVNLRGAQEHHKRTAEIDLENLKIARDRAAVTDLQTRPSILMGVSLRRLPNGHVQVFLGPSWKEASFTATAPTLFDALDDLDRQLTDSHEA